MQQLRRCLLRHHLAQTQYGVLEPIGHTGVTRSPRDRLLASAVSGTRNLAREIAQNDLPTCHRQVSPLACRRATAHELATAATRAAARTVLKRFHVEESASRRDGTGRPQS